MVSSLALRQTLAPLPASAAAGLMTLPVLPSLPFTSAHRPLPDVGAEPPESGGQQSTRSQVLLLPFTVTLTRLPPYWIGVASTKPVSTRSLPMNTWAASNGRMLRERKAAEVGCPGQRSVTSSSKLRA